MTDLNDAFDKLRWARQHFEALQREIKPFEESDKHHITVEVNADAGEYVFYVHDLEDPKSDWGLLVGDCLHNARTALDYLIVQLYALVTGVEPLLVPRLVFPIATDPASFDPKSGKTSPSVVEMRKHLAFSGYLARIEELQPYNVGNASIWGAKGGAPLQHGLPHALRRLSALDNIDKHRVVHATWGRVDFLQSFYAAIAVPPGFVSLPSIWNTGPLEDGAEIGRWCFATPLPCEWEPAEMDMKRSFPLRVAIADDAFYSVLDVLDLCLWGVAAVLGLFAPVFDGLQPPLPVTAIPNIE